MNRALLILALLAIAPSLYRLLRSEPQPAQVVLSDPLLSGRKMDLNHASASDLELIPGIGPALAQRIVDGRPYSRISDVERVRGIGPKKRRALEAWAAVNQEDESREYEYEYKSR